MTNFVLTYVHTLIYLRKISGNIVRKIYLNKIISTRVKDCIQVVQRYHDNHSPYQLVCKMLTQNSTKQGCMHVIYLITPTYS